MGRVHDLSPGQVLDGKYQVLSELGRGAMGVVYEAMHVTLGRRVAVKTLLSEMSTDPQLADRFEREARAASAIGHPHIVDVFDLGRTPDGLLYMVMEKLEGVSLAGLLLKQPQLPVALAIQLMTQVLSGLSAAHKNGIVHRDLKPDNIFILQSDERPNFVKIVDFGISKVLSPSAPASGTRPGYGGTMVGTVMGTPLYMSPEQAIGQIEQIDHRTDIYAAGVVLYEILCGRTPYVGDSYPEIMGGLLEGKYPPPRSLRRDIPPHVEAVIAKAMQREIAQRYPSASAMRLALAEGLADVTPPPVIASSASSGQPIPAIRDSSPFSLVEEAPPPPKHRLAGAAKAVGPDPFSPPDTNESFLELADDGDLPIAPRPRPAPRPDPAPVAPLAKPVAAPAGGAKPPGTLAPEGGLSPRAKGYLLKGLGLLALLIAARVAYSFLSPTGSLHPGGSGGKAMTLQLTPDFASAQIDHIPAKPGPLELDLAAAHVFNGTAAGRMTRRFTFNGKPGMTLAVRLPHGLSVPAPGAVAPTTAELAAEYPDQPRPFAEIDGAFVKLALYESCLSGVAGAVGVGGKPGRGRPRGEDILKFQAMSSKAEEMPPPLSELESSARDFLEALQSLAKPSVLSKAAQAMEAELGAARTAWQLEELAALGKESMSAAWHLRRVAVFALLWQRATLAVPENPALVAKRRAQFEEYHQALERYAGEAREELSRLAGAGDALRFARDLAALVEAAKRPSEMAILDGTRRLVAAFNGIILD